MSRDEHAAALLAEYTALKAEQGQRIAWRDSLIYATLTALAALGAGAQQADQPLVLLAIPYAVAVLAELRLAADHKVSQIGAYLAAELAPALGAAGRPVLRWETGWRRGTPGRAVRRRLGLAADLTVYVGAPAAAVAVWALTAPGWVGAGLAAGGLGATGVVGWQTWLAWPGDPADDPVRHAPAPPA